MMQLGRWIVFAAVGLVACSGHARADVEERWFVILLEGQKAGWMMERRTTEDDGRYIQEVDMDLKISRGAMQLEMGMTSRSEEDAEGNPIQLSNTTKQALMEMSRTYDFAKTKVVERIRQGGRTVANTLDMPEGDWLMPGAAVRKAEAMRASGAKEYTLEMLDSSAGLQVVSMTTRVLDETVVDVFGKKVPAVEQEVTNSLMPTVATKEYVDLDGQMVRTAISLGPGMSLEILLSDEQTAKSAFDAPELMASTLVKPDKQIAAPRTKQFARYVVSVEEGDLPELLDEGVQQVNNAAGGRAELVVDLMQPRAVGEVDRDAYLAATTTADKHDPEIKKLAEQATSGIAPGDTAARAEAMRRFVHSYISGKDLSVGFATASEVCRTREGDCSEHGVLLAAMLRADGIPSRVVSGLMYVETFLGKDAVFGYHMWTQALLPLPNGGESWIDLDAMLPGDAPSDATHIALSTSDLSDSSTLNTMVSLGQVLGQLRIEVVETR